MKTIDAYFGDKDYTLEESYISVRLGFALDRGCLIQLCRTIGEGDLYESAALKFRASEYTISSEIKTREDLVLELETKGPWTILACNMKGCPDHNPEHTRFGVWV
jgi:hypothetical protein